MLKRIRKGDIDAFEMLFHLHYPGMIRYAVSLLGKTVLAEEVVQDVFYNIWKNHESLRINRSWQSYLYRSAYNNSMMILRKTKREYSLEDGPFTEPETGNPDPSQQLQFAEVSERVSRAVAGLPDRTREIFLLNRQEGLKYKDIAEKLGISEKTVEAHMGKALAALRNSLEKYRQA